MFLNKVHTSDKSWVPVGDVEEIDGYNLCLEDILQWITGAREIPAEGFSAPPVVRVQHSDPKRLPDVNTCSCQLTLPATPKLTDPTTAVPYLVFAIANSFLFGKEW